MHYEAGFVRENRRADGVKSHKPSKYYDLSKDMALAENPNFSLVKGYLEMASESGDFRATYALATWYLFGNEAVKVNKIKAAKLLKSIAHGQICEAMHDLGYCYDMGIGVRKNEKLAFQYYMKAALLGDPESCLQISQFYSEGLIVPYNKFLSQVWKDRSECSSDEISPSYRLSI